MLVANPALEVHVRGELLKMIFSKTKPNSWQLGPVGHCFGLKILFQTKNK